MTLRPWLNAGVEPPDADCNKRDTAKLQLTYKALWASAISLTVENDPYAEWSFDERTTNEQWLGNAEDFDP